MQGFVEGASIIFALLQGTLAVRASLSDCLPLRTPKIDASHERNRNHHH